MAFSLHGIKVPHRKHTADMPAERMTAATVTIPTVMHIGKPATPIVKVGELVKVGTLIAQQEGYVSSPVYASVSGKVTKIQDMLLSNGSFAPAITIESDGEMAQDESIAAPAINTKEDFVEALKKSGIVGLGGAGFPTYVKFNVDKPVDYLVINGAECEPYITSDTRTMLERGDDIRTGLEAVLEFIEIDKVIFAIEKNKKAAVTEMQKAVGDIDKVQVKALPTIYPQGGEKVLVYHTTKRVIGNGKLPIDVGCIVINCTTLAAIGSYLKTGLPLVEKCVTVDGGCVKEPKNVIAPIGTALKDVFDFCGGFTQEPQKVLYGGPMMGIAVPDVNVPVLKQTNAILALTEKEARLPKATNCIRCGTCINTCPFGINPPALATAFRDKDIEGIKKAGAEICMECGCCSFNCPANRPITQTNKLAKALLREVAMKEKEAK
ncbi:MAG: electron transport complex subunit RsxC [Clostridia bacterium]|nr:electron transport complex subunit RsxC [Clostridia bacterium]